jgi:hypothetical protein
VLIDDGIQVMFDFFALTLAFYFGAGLLLAIAGWVRRFLG